MLFLLPEVVLGSRNTALISDTFIPLDDYTDPDRLYIQIIRLPTLDPDGSPTLRLEISHQLQDPSYARITVKLSEDPWNILSLYRTKIEELAVAPDVHMDQKALTQLSFLTRLQKLDLPCHGLNAQDLQHLQPLKNLTYLNLDSNHFSLNEAQALTTLCNLRELNLNYLERGSEAPLWLTQLSHLTQLQCNTLKSKDREMMPSLPLQSMSLNSRSAQQLQHQPQDQAGSNSSPMKRSKSFTIIQTEYGHPSILLGPEEIPIDD